MFESVVAASGAELVSAAEARLRVLLADRGPVVHVVPPPGVVVVDLAARRAVGGEPLSPQARLLEEGAGHLDAVADLERVVARAAAVQARELAAFAGCRPAAWDRRPGETGAASAATRAARPAVLEPVSEWAVAEVAARLRLSARTAQARLEQAVFLTQELPATLTALDAGTITPAHAAALVELLQPVSADKRAQVETEALERAGTQTVGNLRARVRRIIARVDAAAALRRLVTAATGRRVTCTGEDDGMATLAAYLTGPLARACHEALTAYAQACEVDEHGNRDPRTLDQRRADCLADLILRPHAEHPAVRIALTLIARTDTLTGFGPGADEPGELDGDLVPAPLVRELAATLGLMPRPATDQRSTPEPGDLAAADAEGSVETFVEASVDRSITAPVPGDAATEARIAHAQAAEAAAAAELATAIATEHRLALTDPDPATEAAPQPAGGPFGGPTGLAALRAQREAALHRLLAAQRLTGTALASRPRIALTDQLTGTLLALTDAAELRSAATAGRGLGPPPATAAYRPTDPLTGFVTLRDRRCRFPGCRVRARCADIDHQTPHPHGPTAHDNLACLCEHHHRLSHQAPGWHLHRDKSGGLVWTLPGGHTLTTHPPAVGTHDAPTVTTDPPPPARTAARQRYDQARQAIRTWHPGAGAPHPDIPF